LSKSIYKIMRPKVSRKKNGGSTRSYAFRDSVTSFPILLGIDRDTGGREVAAAVVAAAVVAVAVVVVVAICREIDSTVDY
jgi:hypothetical protein